MENPIDVLTFLSDIVEKNTRHYRSDFAYDQATLREAARSYDMDDRAFYWMSRPSGTWCVKEREVFIRGSGAHSIWTYYADRPRDILAYRVVVTGLVDGKVMGTVQPVNYQEQVRRVLAKAIPATAITLTYESGFADTVPYDRYPKTIQTVRPKDGGITKVRYEAADDLALDVLLSVERRELTRKLPAKHSRHHGR